MRTDHPRTARQAGEVAQVVARCFAGGYDGVRRTFALDYQHGPGARPEYWRVVRRKGQVVAHAGIYEKPVRIGCASVRMGGIGFVCCLPEHRRRGLAARCLEDSLAVMRKAGIQLSLLFGRDRYYTRFGYVGCLPAYTLKLPVTEREVEALENPFAVRPAVPRDVPELAALYNAAAAATPVSVIRTPQHLGFSCRRWKLLDAKNPALFVFRAKKGSRAARAYAVWKDNSLWEAAMDPGDEAACKAVLAWLREKRRAAVEKEIVIAMLCPAHPLYAYALRLNHQTEGGLRWTGGGMGRIVDTKAFLKAVQPELSARVAAAGLDAGELRLFVDGHCHDLLLARPGYQPPLEAAGATRFARVWCSQQALLQMVLGALPFEHIPGVRVAGDAALVRAAFPPGTPCVYRLDGF